jgi:hypothetical protein
MFSYEQSRKGSIESLGDLTESESVIKEILRSLLQLISIVTPLSIEVGEPGARINYVENLEYYSYSSHMKM